MNDVIKENYQLLYGDCLERMKEIDDKSIDCIICDLPYGVLNLKWDSVIPLNKLWEHYNRILKPNGVVALFGTEPFSSYLRMSNIKRFKYDYIWIKTKASNFASCRKVPMKYHEMISIFYDKGITYNMPNLHKIEPIKSSRKNKGGSIKMCANNDDCYMQTESGFNKSLLYFSNKSGKGYSLHPTQKPVCLIEELIKIYTNEGDLILDNCMGSGTTGVACLNTNRKFIGIEMNDNYFKISCDRIEKEKSQLTLF